MEGEQYTKKKKNIDKTIERGKIKSVWMRDSIKEKQQEWERDLKKENLKA